jgi:hypothetical protein
MDFVRFFFFPSEALAAHESVLWPFLVILTTFTHQLQFRDKSFKIEIVLLNFCLHKMDRQAIVVTS